MGVDITDVKPGTPSGTDHGHAEKSLGRLARKPMEQTSRLPRIWAM